MRSFLEIRSNLPNLLRRTWQMVRRWLWQGLIAAACVLAFVIAVIKPFEALPHLSEHDVARIWSKSIARLGILPVYPPAEDLHVGDLWAVIVGAEDKLQLLERSVRIAHIDMRGEIIRAHRPTFQLNRNREQDKDDQVPLTLAAFPGVTINHATVAGGTIDGKVGWFGANSDHYHVEEIRIPVAETYGVPVVSAFLKLDEWCSDERTRLYCTDEAVRRVFAFIVGERVYTAAADGRYVLQFELRLLTRVYLTREIHHRNLRKIAKNSEATAPTQNNSPPTLPDGFEQRPSSIRLLRSNGADVQLEETFQRPLVFGYRAVVIALDSTILQKEARP